MDEVMHDVSQQTETESSGHERSRVRGTSTLASFVLGHSEFALLGALALLAITFGLLKPSFWSVDTTQTILRGCAVIGLMVVGQALLLLQKEMDLSVGSVASLAAVVASKMAVAAGLTGIETIAVALLVGAAVGLVNAWLILWMGLPALIATLGTLYAASGLAFVVTDGLAVTNLPPGLTSFAQSNPLGIPAPVATLLLVVLAGQLVLTRTVFGKSVYAIGGSARSAVTAGVPVRRYKLYAFVVTSMLAALAGILLVGRLGVAEPSVGSGAEFAVITAAVVGGVSLFGGVGTIAGAFIGVLFVQVVATGLVTVGFEPTLTRVATGVLLVLAVAFDRVRRRFGGG